MHKRNKEKYGKSNPSQFHIPDNIFDIINDKSKMIIAFNGKNAAEIAYELGINLSTVYNLIKKYSIGNIIKPLSLMEDDLEKWLISNSINYVKHDRNIIKPIEIDFILPDIKV
jgi:DNA invertase Pin-like site-specific DNA recombinase